MGKKKVLLLFILLIIANLGYAQQYKSHRVAKGENVYRIAKRYNTTPEAIYRINPTAKDGVKEGEILAIPVVGDQEYKTHTVEEGDTSYSISKKYETTVEAIFLLNPEAVNGINLGQILRVGVIEKKDDLDTDIDKVSDNGKKAVLDSLRAIPETQEVIRYKTHKVKRKETLYGIAKKYDITVDDIKKNNKRLYSEDIKKRDKLRIPVYAEGQKSETLKDANGSRISATTSYIVKPKETKFGIARKHGITMSQLEELNPNMNPAFPVGMEIKVPTSVFVEYGDVLEPGFELYEIQPKETMFSLVRRLDISSDSLIGMNPYIKEGLKAGMVITIPIQNTKDALGINFEEGMAIDLERKLYNFTPKKIALMLPFNLESLNLEERKGTEEYLKNKQSLRIALDFYSGVLIAIDSAKTKGITTELSVFDTEKNNNEKIIKKIIAESDFDEMDAVIGPLFQINVEAAAAELKKYDVPVFSPVSNKESKLYGNFFQARPTDIMLQDKLMSYVAKDSITDRNIIIIVQDGKKHEEIKNRLIAKFPNAKVAKIQKGNYLYAVDLNKVLVPKKPNFIFLESDDVAMVSNVTGQLNAKAESHQITLFTTNKNNAFDNDSVKNEYLSKLHLHYPSIYKEFEENDELMSPFVKRYKKEHGIDPNNYAVRGFDITYDILMRLGTADDLYQAATFEGTTEYVENKFNYAKKLLGGYFNKAAYLIRFDDDLKLTEVK